MMQMPMDIDTDSDSGDDGINVQPQAVVPVKKAKVTGSKRKGAATYKSSFKREWTIIWPFITMGATAGHFRCNVCNQEGSCRHQGLSDIKRHISSKGHKDRETLQKTTRSIALFTHSIKEMSSAETKIRRAEIKMAMSLVEHNVPLAFSDHLSPLMKECFPDSPTAAGYRSARTKTTCIVNGALAPYFHQQLVKQLREQPFSLSTDGSNDTGLEKMNPLTVKLFDINQGVVYRFLDMCTTSGSAAATAQTIFSKMDEVFSKEEIPWRNCIALSLDNASVNMGVRNSIKSRVLHVNPDVYVHGCPAHMVHNNAHAAGNAYAKVTKFEVEDMAVDLAYWSQPSTWRFQARFKRLQELFSNPMTELHLMFYQATLPTFTDFNLLLQRQCFSVHLLHKQMHLYIRKLMSKFMKPEKIKDIRVSDIQYKAEENQLPDSKLTIGFTTRGTLNRLLEGGDISETQVKKFLGGVRSFFCEAVSYALSRLPLDEPVLQHATFVDWHQKMEASIDDVLFFIDRFQHLLPFNSPQDQDRGGGGGGG
eukprot:XP_011674325.1 PREDICTED: uncharacterized protein LOC105443158 [Strongylocentrotus purpuratus]